MAYQRHFTDSFLKDTKSIKKDTFLINRLHKKIDEIVQMPEHYKPLRGPMQGLRRAHIDPYVLIFEIKDDVVIFHAFKHHKYAYE